MKNAGNFVLLKIFRVKGRKWGVEQKFTIGKMEIYITFFPLSLSLFRMEILFYFVHNLYDP